MILVFLAIVIQAYVIYTLNKQVRDLTGVIKDLVIIFSKQSSTIKKEMTSKGLPVGENYFSTADIPDKDIKHSIMRTLNKKK